MRQFTKISFSGPFIQTNTDPLIHDIKLPTSLAKVQFTQSVMEAFSTLFPPPRMLRKEVNTMLGFVVEGEFVCDSSATPLQVNELSNNFGGSKSEKALPANGHRMALVTAGFQV